MEVLSEHLCQGWLEGYLLTGRHGLFNCYEAFIHIVDSMFNQHAKWLKVTREIPWRRPIAVAQLPAHLARLAAGPQRLLAPGSGLHRPRRQQEGRGHPRLPAAGREHAALGRRPLPAQPQLRERDRRRQAAGARLPVDGRRDRALHARPRHLGLGLERRRARAGRRPRRAAATCRRSRRSPPSAILREHLPDLKVRVVNVVDLMRLQPESEHPHGLSDREFDALFTTDRPVVFAYHGYPWLIHRLTYRRTNHDNLHVRGYKEEGTTTTPFDMVMLNDLDRFHLVIDVIDRVPGLGARAAHAAPGDGRRAAALPRLDARARRGPPGRPRLGLAGLSPRRQRRLDEPEAAPRRRRRVRQRRVEDVRRTCAAVGHRVVHGGSRFREPVRDRRRGDGRRSASSTPLAPLHNAPALRAIDDAQRALAGRPARRRLRHGVPRDDARGGDALRRAAALARVGRAPLRLPRPLGRVGAVAGARCRGSSSATSAAAAR